VNKDGREDTNNPLFHRSDAEVFVKPNGDRGGKTIGFDGTVNGIPSSPTPTEKRGVFIVHMEKGVSEAGGCSPDNVQSAELN
jgi:hypothetical protein